MKFSSQSSGSFDLGTISFAISGLSSFFLYRKSNKALDSFIPVGSYGRAAVLFSHLLVASNYALGAFFAYTEGRQIYVKFATYCTVFTFLWLVIAGIGWILVTRTQLIGVISEDDDELVDLYGLQNSSGVQQSRSNFQRELSFF